MGGVQIRKVRILVICYSMSGIVIARQINRFTSASLKGIIGIDGTV